MINMKTNLRSLDELSKFKQFTEQHANVNCTLTMSDEVSFKSSLKSRKKYQVSKYGGCFRSVEQVSDNSSLNL
jgi:hypothetical protein